MSGRSRRVARAGGPNRLLVQLMGEFRATPRVEKGKRRHLKRRIERLQRELREESR